MTATTPTDDPSQASRLVTLSVRPCWAFIAGVRELGHSLCEAAFPDTRVAERVRLILQEALENAVKYSVKESDAPLELCISTTGAEVEIRILSVPEHLHLDELRRELEWLASLEPEQAYAEAFRRAAAHPEQPARLGLARMQLEGKMQIRLEEKSGKIELVARGPI